MLNTVGLVFALLFFTLIFGAFVTLILCMIYEFYRESRPKSKTKLPLKIGVTYQHEDYPSGLWTVEAINDDGVKFVRGEKTLYATFETLRQETFWEVPRTGATDPGGGQAVPKDEITPRLPRSKRFRILS